jgi:hypothetical protein
MHCARLCVVATGAVFGRCADVTDLPSRRRKCPEIFGERAISREKSGIFGSR